ncbi:MAG: Lrp/AsnC ligand binding domain-containing protein [Candidatus Hodarchaeota archaeon]
MIQAIVLLCTMPGNEQQIKEELLKIKEVKSCRITFGEYDLILEVYTEKIKYLGTLITKKIRSVEGVTKTATLIIGDSLNNAK